MATDILFYTSNFRALSTTYIGYVYELSQHFNVIVATEPLDAHTKEFLLNKLLFPGLKEVVEINQYSLRENIFIKNRRLVKIAAKIIEQNNPKVVLTSSDNDSLFEMYLLRGARKRGIRRVTISATINAGERKDVAVWVKLQRRCMAASWMAQPFASIIADVRAHLGHLVLYWLLPMLNLQPPFWGKASHVLLTGHTGMRDSEFHVALSSREYGIYLRSGVPKARLSFLPHPVTRSSRYAFEKLHLSRPFSVLHPMAVVLHPVEANGFTRNLENIDSTVYLQARKSILSMLPQYLNGWTLILKPHPSLTSISELKNRYGDVLDKFQVLDSSVSVEPYLMQAKLVIDLPRAASTSTLFTTLANPKAWVAALDLHQEFLGDYYCETKGVSYIKSLNEFAEFLQKVTVSKTPSLLSQTNWEDVDLPRFLISKGILKA